MSQKATNLIWLDLEMTGLNTEKDVIIEIATIVTDNQLNILAEGPVSAINQPQAALDGMDKWCTKQHTKSGLVERVLQSSVMVSEAEQQTLEFLAQYVEAGKSPMCGNTICMDRRFLARYMPTLEKYFHYRHLDVSTLKILVQQWAPKLMKAFDKESKHLALQDIRDSIDELKYYRKHFLQY